ncbi:MAG: Rpn family recombination-promoting nuclease/putative transposase [Treponema sp.]|nr:Rpn family recombination-promoting nuclease/putative transposase [Treponema sp.]
MKIENENIPQSVTLAVVGDENRHKRYEELTFMDDFMFGKIMSDKQNCKRFLEILLHIDPDTEIADPTAQSSVRVSPNAKSITVDIRTHDSLNDYDLEAQKQPHANLPKRARYYQAMMDIDFLAPGKDYMELRNNYIIFICLHDLFHKGLPIYTFRNRCDEDTSVELNDRTTKIFLNASKCDIIKDKELKAFMEYVKTGRTADDYTEIINDLVQKARENPTWKREYMDAMMDAVHQQREMREAEKKGERNARLETARRMLSRGKATTQEIAEDTGLTVEEIEQLR